VTLIGAGLFVLVVSTTWAIASVSLWWVPVYLALLVVIFVMPPRRQFPSSASKSGVESATVDIADSGSGLRVDCGDGMDEVRSLNQFDTDLLNLESTELMDSDANLTAVGTAKRRGRVRARKVAKPASEPVPDSFPVAWIQVGPGKFIRVEGGIQVADSAPAAPAQTEPLEEQEPYPSSGASPGDLEPIPVSDDRARKSVTEEYGIAPSAFSLVTACDSLAKPSDDLPDKANQDDAETAAPDELGGQLPPTEGTHARLLWQPGTSRRWVSRIQRGIVGTAPRVSRASWRRVIRTAPNSRVLVGTSYAPNMSIHDAASRAFGRMLHVQHTLRPRSPPCR
jgi:hypothetical protein